MTVPVTETAGPRRGIFERVGRFCARRPWIVVSVWGVLFLLALPIAPRAADVLRPGGFSLDTLPASQTTHLLEQRIGLPPSALVIVIHGQRWPQGR